MILYTAFRKKVYSSIEELQKDVDEWLNYYNKERPHSGKYCYGKMPMQTFLDSKKIALEKNNERSYSSSKAEKKASAEEVLV